METYEEVMRRNEIHNYTVKWRMSNGTQQEAQNFPGYEQAVMYASEIGLREYVEDVQIYRAGRHPTASRWLSPQRQARTITKSNTGVFVNEEAWAIPAGYVDGDADKHGPVVVPMSDNRLPARSNAEKAQWARKNSPIGDVGLLGFRAI
jgi:hypothetical protein